MTFAMVFPGQGSQSVGMLSEMAQYSEIVTDTFGEATEVLQYNLWERVCEGPEELLGQTAVTQPAVLAASVALWRIWCAKTELRPVAMAGHSLGEYSALVCAGVLRFTDAVALVARRGELMQQAVPEGIGAMAAVLGLDDAAVVEVCQRSSANTKAVGIVEAVNFNSPGQVVIAGDRAAVEHACTEAKAAGARRAQMLAVSVPAHSSLMKPAALEFAKVVADVELSTSQVPVIHNVGQDQVSDVRDALVRQLYNPVPWTSIVHLLAARGVSHLVECGPGRVLSGLARRIDKSLAGSGLQTPDSLAKALEQVEQEQVEQEQGEQEQAEQKQ